MNNYILSDLLLFVGVIISLFSQIFVSTSYNKYKKIRIKNTISGFEVAKKILDKNGLSNIYITCISGKLTDHYDSSRKVIRLSNEIFNGDSIASVSVASHEVGHALQDKEGYSFFRFRSLLFPLVKISSYGGYISILLGVLFGIYDLIIIGIALEIIILVFQLITLPVEFDASRRAKKELIDLGLIDSDEINGVSKMLKAAAYTYVAAVVTTLLQVLRLVLMFTRRND